MNSTQRTGNMDYITVHTRPLEGNGTLRPRHTDFIQEFAGNGRYVKVCYTALCAGASMCQHQHLEKLFSRLAAVRGGVMLLRASLRLTNYLHAASFLTLSIHKHAHSFMRCPIIHVLLRTYFWKTLAVCMGFLYLHKSAAALRPVWESADAQPAHLIWSAGRPDARPARRSQPISRQNSAKCTNVHGGLVLLTKSLLKGKDHRKNITVQTHI